MDDIEVRHRANGLSWDDVADQIQESGRTAGFSRRVDVTRTGLWTLRPPPSDTVGYVTSDWSTGFTATITITNTGTSTLTGWTLGFSFPSSGQQVGQGWSATYRRTGTAVTATNLSYNGTLAPGASTSFGFNGTHTGSNPKPTTFTLNGSPCTVS